MPQFDIERLILSIVPFMFAITIHEFMHGYAAYKLGDNTAKYAGRLTFNPISHIDPIGLIVLFLTQMIGWTKPVPVNYYNLQHKYGVAIVSLAGPLSNLFAAIVSALFFHLLIDVNMPVEIGEPLIKMLILSVNINIALFVFNLLPIMPMDGARIIWNFLPRDLADKYEETEKFYFIIILVLFLSNAIYYIINPIIVFMKSLLNMYYF